MSYLFTNGRPPYHCKYFPTFEHLRSAVISTFKKYMNNAIMVICVMKQLREDAGIL